jgi:hypothetical protein
VPSRAATGTSCRPLKMTIPAHSRCSVCDSAMWKANHLHSRMRVCGSLHSITFNMSMVGMQLEGVGEHWQGVLAGAVYCSAACHLQGVHPCSRGWPP